MSMALNLAAGKRAERKQLITVAAWGTPSTGSVEPNRVILGVRTEDSAIEFNPDIQKSTDILGINYTDVNKTEPQQDFDPHFIIGPESGAQNLAEYLSKALLGNKIQDYTNSFTIYIITAFISESGTSSTTSYYAVKHTECSIIPKSLGGSDFVNMPIEVHLSNKITEGSVDKLTADFSFA